MGLQSSFPCNFFVNDFLLPSVFQGTCIYICISFMIWENTTCVPLINFMPQIRLIWDTVQFSICNYKLLYLNQRWPRCWWIWGNKARDNGPVNRIQGVTRQHGGRKPQSCGSTQRYAVGKLSNIWWNATELRVKEIKMPL